MCRSVATNVHWASKPGQRQTPTTLGGCRRRRLDAPTTALGGCWWGRSGHKGQRCRNNELEVTSLAGELEAETLELRGLRREKEVCLARLHDGLQDQVLVLLV